MDLSDNELIHRFTRGDRDAFSHVVERWDAKVLNLAYRLTGNLEDARDIRQTTFLRVLKSADRFNGTARFSTWLHRVVLNLCLDRKRSLEVRETHHGHGRAVEEPADAGTVSPARAFERGETAGLVADAVRSLPPAERVVVVLRHYQGLAFPEIARILGAPPTTVKSRMTQGLRLLRERLKHVEI